MKTFKEFINEASLNRSALSNSNLWCGEATLESFGITRRGKPAVTCWANVQGTLEENGYKLEWIIRAGTNQMTLNKFVQTYTEGSYILFTNDHIMSLIDGELTDTETHKGGRRKVLSAFKVTK